MKRKPSLYTSVIRLEAGYYIIYNSLSDKYIVTRSSNMLDLNDIGELRSDSKLYKQLCDIGALVEDNSLEERSVLNRYGSIVNDDTELRIFVNPTLNCNFRCWYCYEQHDGMKIMSFAVLESIYKLINKKVDSMGDIKALSLSFFGGEPLLGYEQVVKPLIQFCQTMCNKKGIDLSVHFTTNGYLLDAEKIIFLTEYNASFQITLDGDCDTHNKIRYTSKGGSYHKIIANIKQLANAGLNVILRINYTTDSINKSLGIADDLKSVPDTDKRHIRIDLQRVWQDRDGDNDYLDEMIDKITGRFNAIGYNVSNHYLRNNYENPCYADYRNQLLVNYNGDIFKCTARDFVCSSKLGYLNMDGDIIWNDRQLCSKKHPKSDCSKCRIFPICGGGCFQRNIENQSNSQCVNGYTDEYINDWILKRFQYLYVK